MIGPQIFDKLKTEFNLEEVAAQAHENLKVSWQRDDQFYDANEESEEEKKGEAAKEESVPKLDDSVRKSIQRVIEERMSISMIEDDMQGGWQQEHVGSSVNDSVSAAA